MPQPEPIDPGKYSFLTLMNDIENGRVRLPPFAKTDALAAVTHVNGTARIQTVSSESNQNLYKLLVAFKARTGFGVLCNTSLNFNGRGFINKIKDLSAYALEHNLDGFVVEGRAYLLKVSNSYRTYLKKPNRISSTISLSQV